MSTKLSTLTTLFGCNEAKNQNCVIVLIVTLEISLLHVGWCKKLHQNIHWHLSPVDSFDCLWLNAKIKPFNFFSVLEVQSLRDLPLANTQVISWRVLAVVVVVLPQ